MPVLSGALFLVFRIKAESESENTDTSGIYEYFQGMTISSSQPTLYLSAGGLGFS